MLRFSSIATVFALALVACSGDEEETVSGTADPTVDLTQSIGERPDGFPCPPFTGVYVTEAEVYGDDDGDGVSNCQEDQVGSPKGNADSDGDGVSDGVELSDLLNPPDTDGDSTPDWDDADDDGDGCDTIDEGTDDLDKDGVPAYLDPNENPCEPPDDTGATGSTADTGTTTTDTDTDTSTDTGTTDTDTSTDTGTTDDTGTTTKTN